jgi:transcription termination/antitermination protein NusG
MLRVISQTPVSEGAKPQLNTMSLSVQVGLESALPAAMLPAAAYQQAHWYAVYTVSRHEKVVARQMNGNGLDHFLPLYKSVRRWKDRRKELELPLFPGYVFVRIASQDRLRVQKLTGVLQIVSFNGRLAPLPEDEIEALRNGLARNAWEPHPYLKVGRRVRVRSGPMAGVDGILVRRKDRFRLVLSVDLIRQAVALEVDGADVEPMTSA